MAVEVPAYEVSDLSLVLLVEILELVGRRELLDVQAVRQHAIGLALQQVLALEGGDVGNGGEDIGGVGGGPLNAVAVVDAALPRFSVHVEILKVVVEINGAGAEVAAKQGGMGGEDGGDIDAALLAEGQADTSQPLVELNNDSALLLVGDILWRVRKVSMKNLRNDTSPKNQAIR